MSEKFTKVQSNTQNPYTAISNRASRFLYDNGRSIIHDVNFERLIQIQGFIDAVMASDELGFQHVDDNKSEKKGLSFKNLKLAFYFSHITNYLEWLQILDEFYVCSEHVKLFCEVCQTLRIGPGTLRVPEALSPINEKCQAILFNDLINIIRINSRDKYFLKKIQNRKSNSLQVFKGIKKYIDDKFSNNAKISVIIINLGYKKNDVIGRDGIFCKKERLDQKTLFNNLRKNKIFSQLNGYMVKLEFNEEVGFHFHCVFLFDKLENNISKRIGDYWTNYIVPTNGVYFNRGIVFGEYDVSHGGIVEIDLVDDDKLQNFLHQHFYQLCTDEQYIKLKFKINPKTKVFSKGEAVGETHQLEQKASAVTPSV